MNKISLVLLLAGGSSRFDLPVKKQWLRIRSKPLWQFVLDRFKGFYEFEKIVLVASAEDYAQVSYLSDELVVVGGATREDSLRNALDLIDSEYLLVSDVARCCVSKDLIARVVSQCGEADCVVPALKVVDTLVDESGVVDRDRVRRIQTPQLSRTAALKSALKKHNGYTDESTIIAASGGSVIYVDGEERAAKLTYGGEIKLLDCLSKPSGETFVGFGFDTHAFEEGKRMVLGGVAIDVPYGFKAHSDGDVAIHALIDAMLGATALGDIGTLFPDTDATYKNIDSRELLKKALDLIESYGYELCGVDLTIMAQKPRLEPYKKEIAKKLAQLLDLNRERVNVKATTMEKMGFVGRGEGVIVQAVATVRFFDWSCYEDFGCRK